MKKIGVLVSGQGTNLQAIIDACKDGRIPDAEVALVISDRTDAYALERARNVGVATTVILREDFEKRKAFNMAIADALEEAGVDVVCLAGFMRILSKSFVRRFYGRCLNIHPSLLPSFPGLEGQKQAWDYGVKVSGCSVHYVDEGCDTGPVIIQRAVRVDDCRTADELAAKILREEHMAYPEAIKLHLSGRLTIDGRKVSIAPE